MYQAPNPWWYYGFDPENPNFNPSGAQPGETPAPGQMQIPVWQQPVPPAPYEPGQGGYGVPTTMPGGGEIPNLGGYFPNVPPPSPILQETGQLPVIQPPYDVTKTAPMPPTRIPGGGELPDYFPGIPNYGAIGIGTAPPETPEQPPPTPPPTGLTTVFNFPRVPDTNPRGGIVHTVPPPVTEPPPVEPPFVPEPSRGPIIHNIPRTPEPTPPKTTTGQGSTVTPPPVVVPPPTTNSGGDNSGGQGGFPNIKLAAGGGSAPLPDTNYPVVGGGSPLASVFQVPGAQPGRPMTLGEILAMQRRF